MQVHYNSKTSTGGLDTTDAHNTSQDNADEEADEEVHVVTMRRGPHGPYQKIVTTDSPREEGRESTSSLTSKKNAKRANLYAWLSLQSLPEV